MVGTSEAAVSHWVSGGHNFTLSTIANISAALDADVIQVTASIQQKKTERV